MAGRLNTGRDHADLRLRDAGNRTVTGRLALVGAHLGSHAALDRQQFSVR
jgi:hypothetical protein